MRGGHPLKVVIGTRPLNHLMSVWNVIQMMDCQKHIWKGVQLCEKKTQKTGMAFGLWRLNNFTNKFSTQFVDNENKRRRYCLMCNVFKPERCHHCSACNRCVLNMDHHCPWINNCVGFWNRKYFLLLLIYVLIMTYFNFFSMLYDFIKAVEWGFDHKFLGKDDPALSRNILIMIAYILDFIVACLMTAFLKFNVMLHFQ